MTDDAAAHTPVTAPADGPARAPSLGGNFWRLWGSSAVSNLADGVLKVALPLVAVRLTDSPGLVAGLTLALTLPWLLFALPAGVLSDRWDRRWTMVAANVVRAVLAAVVAVCLATDRASIALLYVVAFLVGTTETGYDTSAQSILPQLVPRALLSRANGRLFSAELVTNQFVGPPLGGFLMAIGAALAFAVPAAAWLAAVGLLLMLNGRFRVHRAEPTTLRQDLVEGLRFLLRHRLLRRLAVIVGVSNGASNAAWAVLVLYAVGPDSAVGLSEPGFGVLLSVTAVGSVLGSLVVERAERLLGRFTCMVLSGATTALVIAAPAISTNVVWLGVTSVLFGVGLALWNVITVSLRQRVTPDRLLGRVNSAYRLVAWGSMPLGALVGGLLGEWLGLRAVFAIMGVISVLVLLLLIGLRGELARMDEDAVMSHPSDQG